MTHVNLITRHAARNYGSVLQTIATNDLLKSVGADVTVVDYRQPGHEDTGWSLANQSAGSVLPFAPRLAYATLRHPGAVRTGKIFESALRSDLTLTDETYRSSTELRNAHNFSSNSLYCVGSDQVWNLNTNVDNSPYYLDFAPAGGVRFSLASSIGMTSLPAKEESRFVDALRQFKGVSVREAEAAEYLRSLGVDALQHIDPTLAVSPETWRHFGDSAPAKSPYVLVYQLNGSPDFSPIVDAVAKQLALPVKRIEYWRGPRSFSHPSVVRPTIKQFVSLFKNAAFVVTDSFHGTVFSTTFSRPFVAVAPPHYPGRIHSLLKLTGQEKRLVQSPSGAAVLAANAEEMADASTVLRDERDRIRDYLEGMVRFNQDASI
ncbi:polysaccharide pyruvyl transferase family protein [Microbacterium aurantiacum]|uniref:Polysaccharide pyruvyl transferase family protein n=1 Tax=Microbacterium aurantiacum TaxID=162393 RepID=A0ABT8FV98_9MICO|nr:polysaccharide pyruvyl transferase family protein [Microbacterium aurantiacum]MDN4465135.1 polysaccharide pyruvyl transferase family protein [Microbacterium aurantiacum]